MPNYQSFPPGCYPLTLSTLTLTLIAVTVTGHSMWHKASPAGKFEACARAALVPGTVRKIDADHRIVYAKLPGDKTEAVLADGDSFARKDGMHLPASSRPAEQARAADLKLSACFAIRR